MDPSKAQRIIISMAFNIRQIYRELYSVNFRFQSFDEIDQIKDVHFFSRYNVNRLWFPQLSTIVEHYKFDDNNNLCDLLDVYTSSLKSKSVSNVTSEVCVPVRFSYILLFSFLVFCFC